MNKFCQHFFTCTGRAIDKDGDICFAHPPGKGHQLQALFIRNSNMVIIQQQAGRHMQGIIIDTIRRQLGIVCIARSHIQMDKVALHFRGNAKAGIPVLADNQHPACFYGTCDFNNAADPAMFIGKMARTDKGRGLLQKLVLARLCCQLVTPDNFCQPLFQIGCQLVSPRKAGFLDYNFRHVTTPKKIDAQRKAKSLPIENYPYFSVSSD